MGLTRRATCIEELLEACGDPEGMLKSIQHARNYRQGLSTAGESFIDGSEDEDNDDSSSATGSESSSSSPSGSDAGVTPTANDYDRAAGNGKRYEGTDEERAERLARMMAAQCTMEAPEKVGLRTGWKPSTSGFGVVPDGTTGGNLGAWALPLDGLRADTRNTSPVPDTPVSSTRVPVGITPPAGGFQFAFTRSLCQTGLKTTVSDSNDNMNVGAIILAAQRAYIAVAASAAGVDGAEVPRSGREAYIALHRCYKLDNPS